MSIPADKEDKLAKEISKDLAKEIKRHYKNLRDHDLGPDDATRIVKRGCNITPIPTREDLEKP